MSPIFSLSLTHSFFLSLEREKVQNRENAFFLIQNSSQIRRHTFSFLSSSSSLSLLKDEVNDDEEYDEYSNTIAVATLFLSSSSSSLSLLKDEVNDDDEYYS